MQGQNLIESLGKSKRGAVGRQLEMAVAMTMAMMRPETQRV